MNPSSTSFGVVYCATTQRHLTEAMQSMGTVRSLMPSVPGALFTQQELAEGAKAHFEHVVVLPQAAQHFDDKIEAMRQSPFKKSLFLDADTYLLEPISELVELLDRFDLAYTHEIDRGICYEPECPECFVEPCTAVVAWRKTPAVTRLFDLWRTRYDEENQRRGEHPLMCYHDQGAFRHVLYHHGQDVSCYVLPAEYNLRVYAPWFAGATVKILHGREVMLQRALRARLNRDITIRTGDGMSRWERMVFNSKRWIKNRILKRPAAYDFRLRGLTIHKAPQRL
jgi:hypothetical protein